MYARTASVRIVKRDSTRSISYKTHPRKESKRNFKMHVRLLLSYSEISRNAWLSLIGCLLLDILRVCVSDCVAYLRIGGARIDEALLPLLSLSLRLSSSVDRTNDLGQKSLITRTLNRKTLYSLLLFHDQQSTQHTVLVLAPYLFSDSEQNLPLFTEYELNRALHLLSKGVEKVIRMHL